MVSIATNFNGQFTEIPERRIVTPAGQFASMTRIYQGMEYDFANWNPHRGSWQSDFPNMYLQTANRQDRGGNLIEVSLEYIGTLNQQASWSDLLMSGELLQQNFSWSGPAQPVGGALCIFSYDVIYSTFSVTFNYTSYKFISAPLFQSLAASFLYVIDAFANITTQFLQPGTIYSGYPIIPIPPRALTMLTRFTCQQQTPNSLTTKGTPDAVNAAGVHKCSETWQLAFNHGSLGFAEVNP